MTVPAVPAYSGTVPNKNTQTPRDFSNSADLFLPWLATTFPNAIAAFATQVNIVGSQCDADAVTAAASTAMLNAAIATVGATKWVSGTTYAIGDVRWSPIDYLAYRRKTAGAGTSDPSADAANWAAQSSALSIGETSGTAYRGDRGKTAYDHSQATGNAHGATTAVIADSADKRYCTDAQKAVIAATSGTNTGDGQAILVSGTNIKTINSASILGSGDLGIIGETSGTAYRGDRGKTAYDHSQATGNAHGATTAVIADSADKRYCTDAQKAVIAATSGTNTGDGQAILVSGTNIKTINSASILGSGDLGIATGFSHMDVLTSGTTWTCPAGVATIKLTLVSGGSGTGSGWGPGGTTSFTGGTLMGTELTIAGGVSNGTGSGTQRGSTFLALSTPVSYGTGGQLLYGYVSYGGSTVIKYLAVVPGTVYPIAIGAGGTEGAGGYGGVSGVMLIEY